MQSYYRPLKFKSSRKCWRKPHGLLSSERRINTKAAPKVSLILLHRNIHRVIGSCSSDMSCHPSWGVCVRKHVGYFGKMASADRIKDDHSLIRMHERRTARNYSFLEFLTLGSLQWRCHSTKKKYRVHYVQPEKKLHSKEEKRGKKVTYNFTGRKIDAHALLGLNT